jgi:hypothetical protein
MKPTHVQILQACAYEATAYTRLRYSGIGHHDVITRSVAELVAKGHLRAIAGVSGPRDSRQLYVTTLEGREALRAAGHTVTDDARCHQSRTLLPSEKLEAARQIRARNAARVAQIMAQRR